MSQKVGSLASMPYFSNMAKWISPNKLRVFLTHKVVVEVVVVEKVVAKVPVLGP